MMQIYYLFGIIGLMGGIAGIIIGWRLRSGGSQDCWINVEGKIIEYAFDWITVEYFASGRKRLLKHYIVEPNPFLPWPKGQLIGSTIPIRCNLKHSLMDHIATDAAPATQRRNANNADVDENWYLIPIHKFIIWASAFIGGCSIILIVALMVAG